MMLVRAIALKAELIRLPINSDPLKELNKEQNVDRNIEREKTKESV